MEEELRQQGDHGDSADEASPRKDSKDAVDNDNDDDDARAAATDGDKKRDLETSSAAATTTDMDALSPKKQRTEVDDKAEGGPENDPEPPASTEAITKHAEEDKEGDPSLAAAVDGASAEVDDQPEALETRKDDMKEAELGKDAPLTDPSAGSKVEGVDGDLHLDEDSAYPDGGEKEGIQSAADEKRPVKTFDEDENLVDGAKPQMDDSVMNTECIVEKATNDEAQHDVASADIQAETKASQKEDTAKAEAVSDADMQDGTTETPARYHSEKTAGSAEEPNDSKRKAPHQDGNRNKQSKKNKHKDPRMLDTRRRIQLSCRDNDLQTAIKAYEEAIAENVELEAQSYYNLLNLCDGLGKSIVHVGTPKGGASSPTSFERDGHADKSIEVENGAGLTEKQHAMTHPFFMSYQERLEYALRIKERMSQRNLPLNETAYSAIIKLLAKNQEFEKAERMLDEAESVQQCKPKLRLYSSVLTAYCEASQMLDALRIWKRLKEHEGVELTERELIAMMRCAIVTGDSLVMEFVLTELAEEVPVPSKDTVAAILEWFGVTHSQHEQSLTARLADAEEVKRLLDAIANRDQLERPPGMGPVVSTNGWRISSACLIEHETGKLKEGCLEGFLLKPVPLSSRAVREMIEMNEHIVFDGKVAGNNCQFQGGRKGKKRNDFSPESRRNDWNNFIRFLDRKEKTAEGDSPFEVVIDGANIGFHQQNFSEAPKHVDYTQIDWMVRYFQQVKKQRVLLVMHSRHFSDKMLPQKFRPLYDSWNREGILYRTPFGMNDDWFWMHAALKYNLLVVTNDEMRDHHFQMLAPRFFLRWKERQQIRFGFGNWEHCTYENCLGNKRQRQVILECPAVYSRRIQKVQDGLIVPLAKRGDENRFMDGSHYASEDEPKEETYLCIRPKTPSSKADESKNEE